MRILVVNDDPAFARSLEQLLVGVGFEYKTVMVYHDVMRVAFQFRPHLVLLSPLVSGPDVAAICYRFRDFYSGPIIVLDDGADESERVAALQAGADHYLSREVGGRELLAHIQARTRPPAHRPVTDRLPYRDPQLEIDLARERVVKHGRPVLLTPTEFKLLAYLVRHATEVVAPETLLQKALGTDYHQDADVINVYIARLRTKLEDDPQHPRYLVNARGLGYAFQPQK